MDAIVNISIMTNDKNKKTFKHAVIIPESAQPLLKKDPVRLEKYILNKALEDIKK